MTSVYRKFHFASHLMVMLGIIANAVAELDSLIFLIGLGALSVSYALFRDRLISPIPRWAVNTMLALALILMFRAATGELTAVVSIVAQYLIYLTLIKMFESRTPRDQAQVIMLSLLVATSAVLTSVTLQVAIVLAIYVPVALWTVILFQLYAGQLRTHSQRAKANLVDAAAAPLNTLDRTARRTIRRLIATTMVGVTATSAVVFLLMPRDVGGGAFGDWQPASYGATTGFNNEVRLGRPGTLTENPTVVLEASFRQILPDGTSVPFRPGQIHRLRGAVLDDFDRDSAVWFRSARSENTQRPIRVFPSSSFPPGRDTKGASIEIAVSIRNLQSPELFSLWKPEELAIGSSSRRATISPVDGVIRLRNHRGPLNYSVLVAPDAPTRIEQRDRRTLFDRASANTFASENSRIRALALEIIGDRVEGFDPSEPRSIREPGVAERIAAILNDYLSNNYAYTLDMMVLDADQDPIEAFLFENPAGHCEYFASALAALCRSVWIDARVVTGFVATEFDESSQRYTVRQSHAHAWVEVLIDRQLDVAAATDLAADLLPADGTPSSDDEPADLTTDSIQDQYSESSPLYIETWKTFDPSPRVSLQAVHRPPSGALARARQWFDQLQFAWSSSVIGFNRTRQNELLGAESGGPLGLFEVARRLAERTRPEGESGSTRTDLLRSMLSFATVFALVVLAAGLAIVLRKFLIAYIARRRVADGGPDDPDRARREHQARFFHTALATLRRRGIERPANLPASVHAATIGTVSQEAAQAFRSLTDLYYQSRYGHRILSDSQMATAQQALQELEQTLGRTTKTKASAASARTAH